MTQRCLRQERLQFWICITHYSNITSCSVLQATGADLCYVLTNGPLRCWNTGRTDSPSLNLLTCSLCMWYFDQHRTQFTQAACLCAMLIRIRKNWHRTEILVRSNGLSDFSMDIYKWKANLRNCLGKVVNITMAVSKESEVNHAHAIKAYWRLQI
jgi:hypothetical protein